MGARRRRSFPSAAAVMAAPLLLPFVVSFWSQAAAVADGSAPAGKTALQQHVAFFDRDKDGIISFSETEEGATQLQENNDVEFRLKSHGVTLSIGEWQSFDDAQPAYQLDTVWVHVSGVPLAYRHFLGLWAIGTIVGAPQEIDMSCLRKRGIIRIKIAMLDASLLPLKTDIVFGLAGYDITFTLEDDNFQADANPSFSHLDQDGDFDGDDPEPQDQQPDQDNQLHKRAKNNSSPRSIDASNGSTVEHTNMQVCSIAVTPFAPRPRFSPSPAAGQSLSSRAPVSARPFVSVGPVALSLEPGAVQSLAPAPVLCKGAALLESSMPSVLPVNALDTASVQKQQQPSLMPIGTKSGVVPTSEWAGKPGQGGLRRSVRHNAPLTPDGSTAADEDMMSRAMRRAAFKNLDAPVSVKPVSLGNTNSSCLPQHSQDSPIGYVLMYPLASYLGCAPEAGIPGYAYIGMYAFGAGRQDMFCPAWMAV